MRLEGTLDAFSLPDIVQLLSFTRKTGGLHLRRTGGHGLVHVREGAVVSATQDAGREVLARRLAGAGLVDEAALRRAAEVAAAQGTVGLVGALLHEGLVDADAVRELGREQVVDAVFDLLRWSDGEFSFVVDELAPEPLELVLPADDVLTEARGRLADWDSVVAAAPAPDAVLVLPQSPGGEPALSREEWALLALVDGRRTLSEVVELAGRGEYAALRLVAALRGRGLLALRDGDTDAVLRRHELLLRVEGRVTGVAPDPEPRTEADAPDAAPSPSPAALAPAAHAVAAALSGSSTVPAQPGSRHALGAPTGPGLVPGPSVAGSAPASGSSVASALARAGAAIPARPEPFTPRRRPEHPDDAPMATVTTVDGTSAVAPQPLPATSALVERDPSVNKSLLLRLIAGVRGL